MQQKRTELLSTSAQTSSARVQTADQFLVLKALSCCPGCITAPPGGFMKQRSTAGHQRPSGYQSTDLNRWGRGGRIRTDTHITAQWYPTPHPHRQAPPTTNCTTSSGPFLKSSRVAVRSEKPKDPPSHLEEERKQQIKKMRHLHPRNRLSSLTKHTTMLQEFWRHQFLSSCVQRKEQVQFCLVSEVLVSERDLKLIVKQLCSGPTSSSEKPSFENLLKTSCSTLNLVKKMLLIASDNSTFNLKWCR